MITRCSHSTHSSLSLICKQQIHWLSVFRSIFFRGMCECTCANVCHSSFTLNTNVIDLCAHRHCCTEITIIPIQRWNIERVRCRHFMRPAFNKLIYLVSSLTRIDCIFLNQQKSNTIRFRGPNTLQKVHWWS